MLQIENGMKTAWLIWYQNGDLERVCAEKALSWASQWLGMSHDLL